MRLIDHYTRFSFAGTLMSFRSVLMVACPFVAFDVPAYSQTQSLDVHTFEISAGPLKQTLFTISRQSGHPILFAPSAIPAITARAIRGSYSTNTALGLALANSGLEATRNQNGSITVRTSPVTKNQQTSIPESAGEKPGSASAQEAARQEYLSVIGVRHQNFLTNISDGATRTDTPLIDTPQSVQVINRDVLSSTQAIRAQDVLTKVSGVTISSGGNSGSGDSVIIRGFNAPVTTDGLVGNSTSSSNAGLSMPTVGIERIDVLKGADSILAGAADPGGVVNVVRKRPQTDPVTTLTGQLGSFANGLVAVDFGRSLKDDSRFRYRIAASGNQTATSFNGYAGQTILYLAPSLGFKTQTTDLVIGYEINYQKNPLTAWTFLGENLRPYRRNKPFGNKFDHASNTTSTPYLDYKQTILKNWSLETKGQYTDTVYTNKSWTGFVLDRSGFGGIYPQYIDDSGRRVSLEELLRGKIKTGPVTQTLLVGGSFQASKDTFLAAQGDFIFDQLQNIDYTRVNSMSGATGQPVFTRSNQIFLQDQITIFERVHLLGSIAHAHTRVNDKNNDSGALSYNAWLPNGGAVITITQNVSIYANYLRSFQPQASIRLSATQVAPPTRGKQVEAGIKTQWFDKKLMVTADVFRTAATNTAYSVPGSAYYILNPAGNINRGIEVDASGELFPGMNIIANYTYNKPKITESLSSSAYLSLVPNHTYSVWATYSFPYRFAKGVGLGFGVSGRSGYAGPLDSSPRFRIKAQRSVDMNVSYRRGSFNTTFGVKNLLDQPQYGNFASLGYIAVLPRRTVLWTISTGL